LKAIDPAPPDILGNDRDQAAFDAFQPHFDEIAQEGIAGGWHPSEIIAAFFNWSILQVVEQAGVDTAKDILVQAQEVLGRQGRA
jgi:hypothetical protein